MDLAKCLLCLLQGERLAGRPPLTRHIITLTSPPLSYHNSLIDSDTPESAQTWTHPVTNDNYHLVFSDEFEVEGRTFWEGDDPFWTAQDM